MTPEVRAARDRIEGYLDARSSYAASLGPAARRGYADESIDGQITRLPTSETDRPEVMLLMPSDLRLVLAALDKAAPAVLTIHDPRSKGTP